MLKKKLKAILILCQLVFLVSVVQQLHASTDVHEELGRKRSAFIRGALSGNLAGIQSELNDNPDQTTVNMGLCSASRKGHILIVNEIISSDLADQDGVNFALFKAVKAGKIDVVMSLAPQRTSCCCKRSNDDIITADSRGIYTAYRVALADDNQEMIQILEPLLWGHLILWARLQASINAIRDEVKLLTIIM